jgi:hypothetical protein
MEMLNKQLGNLIAENLNLNFFFNVSIDNYQMHCLGKYTLITEEYLLNQGFIIYDYAHKGNPLFIEFIKGNIKATLAVNENL